MTEISLLLILHRTVGRAQCRGSAQSIRSQPGTPTRVLRDCRGSAGHRRLGRTDIEHQRSARVNNDSDGDVESTGPVARSDAGETTRSLSSLLAEAGVEFLHPFQTLVRREAADRPDADVLIEAPTGAGKTIAYLLVSLDHLAATNPPIGPTAVLVIAPTRELAQQVDRVFLPFARGVNRRVALLQGGVAFEPQLRNIGRGADIAVGTPGRLLDLLDHGQLDLSGVEVVVVDEADRLADMGFLDDVGRILDAVPSTARTLLVSATLSGAVTSLVRRLRPRPITVRTAGSVDSAPEGLGRGTTENPHQRVEMIRERLRLHVGSLLDASHRSLVFVRTRHSADRWAGWIAEDGRDALALHGGLTNAGRRAAIGAFRAGDVAVLVATDLASRGLDVPAIDLVVHLERSDDEIDYIHRSGRTGRAGAGGVVVNFVRNEQRRPLLAMEARLHVLARDASLADVLADLQRFGARPPRWSPLLGRRTM